MRTAAGEDVEVKPVGKKGGSKGVCEGKTGGEERRESGRFNFFNYFRSLT